MPFSNITHEAEYFFAVPIAHEQARKFGNRHLELGAPSDPVDVTDGLLPHLFRLTEPADVFEAKFRHMFRLTFMAAKFKKKNHDDMAIEVEQNLASLRGFHDHLNLADTGMSERREVGADIEFFPRAHLSRYRVTTSRQNIVTFSDIHLTNRNNRQNFFERANKDLYLDILRYHYGPNEFTLIENGDVEELLIYEPDLETMPDFSNLKWDDGDTWQETFDDRTIRKRVHFEAIVQEHSDYYNVIGEQFISRGAFYRTIGNHDTDLASEDYAQFIRDTHQIDWPTASDFVVLTNDGTVSHLICHGHQFDAVSTERFAKFAGESLSEGSGWSYQGPDRIWTLEMDGDEFLTPWLNGTKLFNNSLSSAVPDGQDQTGNAILEFLDWGDRSEAGFEAIFTGNVAWEYFVNPIPADAYNQEVIGGVRWFKFRHMDEIEIVKALNDQFSDLNVTLVLGHSHEPRLNAGDPENNNATAANYLNSAAAGRFENLIWGIELINGSPTMISWHRNYDDQSMVRTEWSDVRLPSGMPGMPNINGAQALQAGTQLVIPVPGSALAQGYGTQVAIDNLMLD